LIILSNPLFQSDFLVSAPSVNEVVIEGDLFFTLGTATGSPLATRV
jgi:hypothetical protein